MAKPKRPRDPMQLAKLIGDMATGQAPRDPEPPCDSPEIASKRAGGVKGGSARAQKLSPERRRRIAKKAARARWAK